MNIYQIIANELKAYGLACTAVIGLQNNHNRIDYPIWSIEYHTDCAACEYDLVVKTWLTIFQYEKLYSNIYNLQEIIDIYTAIQPRENDAQDPECMLFISWIIRGSKTFRSLYNWEPLKHRFHKVSEIENIIEQTTRVVIDPELLLALEI